MTRKWLLIRRWPNLDRDSAVPALLKAYEQDRQPSKALLAVGLVLLSYFGITFLALGLFSGPLRVLVRVVLVVVVVPHIGLGWLLDMWLQRSLLKRLVLERGLCVGCGYDLRSLPGNRCPECGTSQPVDVSVR